MSLFVTNDWFLIASHEPRAPGCGGRGRRARVDYYTLRFGRRELWQESSGGGKWSPPRHHIPDNGRGRGAKETVLHETDVGFRRGIIFLFLLPLPPTLSPPLMLGEKNRTPRKNLYKTFTYIYIYYYKFTMFSVFFSTYFFFFFFCRFVFTQS